MESDRHARIKDIFLEAAELSSAERPAFLDKACADDPSLRPEVEAFLEFDSAQPDFLEKPVDSKRGDSVESVSADSMLRRLQGDTGHESRYDIRGEVARGGFGSILTVWDRQLRRILAMKVVLDRGDAKTGTPSIDERSLGRFLEEAQVTSQLDHPGVVPVHELGVDEQGKLYFTMKLVKGRNLRAIFDLVHGAEEGWTQARALGVIQKVCEAMAYAHSKGVIHRDLKPANIMVGRFGEVYVMDWGLAHVLGEADGKDIRVRPAEPAPVSSVRTDGREEWGSDSPLLTRDGDVVGTPGYMPPEQARGDLDQMGPASDVYSAGAMLYHLLAGHMPYGSPGSRPSGHEIWSLLKDGPPAKLDKVAKNAPAELVAICNRAMSRNPTDRYTDMSALADDVRAFIEHRVVQAYRTGALIELRKWVQRNKPLAAASLIAVLLSIGGTTAVALVTDAKNTEITGANETLESTNQLLDDTNVRLRDNNAALKRSEERSQAYAEEARLNAEEAQANAVEAGLNAAAATEAKRIALERLQRITRLSDLKLYEQLEARADLLWPARPELVEDMEDWLEEAQELLGRLPEHEKNLAALRAEAVEMDAPTFEQTVASSLRGEEWKMAEVILALEESDLSVFVTETVDGEQAEQFRREWLVEKRTQLPDFIEEIEEDVLEKTRWRFPSNPLLQWQHDNLSVLVRGLTSLLGSKIGSIADVRLRLETAKSIEQITVTRHLPQWREAIEKIAASEHYDGLELSEQVGLIPIGADPESGLWEFWHVESGEPPERGSDGRIRLTDAMGMVLVLIPGGTFVMGATLDPAGPNYDPDADPNSLPIHSVHLAPYFLSKYEMTQRQWYNCTGDRPSQYAPGWMYGDMVITDRNPLTNVSWHDCTTVLQRYGLQLPTEAQWERAARAESAEPYWCGDRNSIGGSSDGIAGNLSDQTALSKNPLVADHWTGSEEWQDGHTVHAPIGTYRANGFGLHDVIGNVSEWCRDWHGPSSYRVPVDPDTGERLLLGGDVQPPRFRVMRGGGFSVVAYRARSAFRNMDGPESKEVFLGVRPAAMILKD